MMKPFIRMRMAIIRMMKRSLVGAALL